MKRVFFHQSNDYKKITHHESDPNFVPLSVQNDQKAQKNGTKKTVYWVKKKPNEEDGKVKGETWRTSEQFIGDWKNNRKDGYGIKIYDNKHKYEGYWKNDLRHGKGTYWVCIGKNKYRKLYTGDWHENKRDGQGIYFYNDGSCYDGTWKDSKREGSGLMLYANGDVYEGAWREDLKHGYGILEKKNGDKFYGFWIKNLKEGQGYYYYTSTSKIYLGEWHEDAPRCGIFTDVDDETIHQDFKQHLKAHDLPPLLPFLKLHAPESILEDSINNVQFLRNIKLVKNKTLHELFPAEFHTDLIAIFKQRGFSSMSDDNKDSDKIPENFLTVSEFQSICQDKLGKNISEETLELIFFVFGLTPEEPSQIDFLMFCRFFYLIYTKNLDVESQNIEDGNLADSENLYIDKESNNISEEENFDDKMNNDSNILDEDESNY